MHESDLVKVNHWNNLRRALLKPDRDKTYDEHFPANRRVLDDPESAHKKSPDSK